MVTMILILGIINAFVLFLLRIVAYVISVGAAGRNEEGSVSGPGPMFFMLSMVFDILFTFLGSILVAAFSRHREYRADKGGAQLAGRYKMIDALQKAMKPATFGITYRTFTTKKIIYKSPYSFAYCIKPPRKGANPAPNIIPASIRSLSVTTFSSKHFLASSIID